MAKVKETSDTAQKPEEKPDLNKEATSITKEEALQIQLNMERCVRLNAVVELSQLRANEAQRNLQDAEQARVSFVKATFEKYGIRDGVDKLNTETCEIARAKLKPVPSPPKDATPEPEKK